MALIEKEKKSMILQNIDASLSSMINGEGVSPQGVFRLRTMAPEIAALIKIREFVEANSASAKITTPKKGGK